MSAIPHSFSRSFPDSSPPSLADLHGIWHADELAEGFTRVVATGHAQLDTELPGGGWPLGAMTELLQPATGAPVWSLLLPGVVAHWQTQGETVVLVGPPHEPFMPALSAAGLPAQAVLWVRTDTAVASLWAAEQALRCADVGTVMAWLPSARTADLRRLQAAAARRADGLLFVLRPERAASSASPARLRLSVRACAQGLSTPERQQIRVEDMSFCRPAALHSAGGMLEVHILKRRGPPLSNPLFLDAHSQQVQALLAVSGVDSHRQPGLLSLSKLADNAGAAILPFATPRESLYALDRIAVAA